MIWRPNPHWNVAATFPRYRVAYAPNPMWLFEGMIRPGGAGWNYSHAVLGSESHKDLQLDPDDLRALKEWVDLNCPLWPDYQDRLARPIESLD